MVTHLLQQRFNGHLTGNGAEIFAHACRLGHEGIVAKRVDLGYESGRSTVGGDGGTRPYLMAN